MSNSHPDDACEPIIVTGAAGFIGYHLAQRLLADGYAVVGVDNLNTYYDVRLKHCRLQLLQRHERFHFHRLDLADRDGLRRLFQAVRPTTVVHLAAQAGVRYSLTNPEAYVDSNLVGFLNVLESCRHCGVQNLLYASSSSVYGANTSLPFSVHDNVDHPLSLYAATKKANELMAHTYSHLYGLRTTGLRFFTVYGPWGRPDMAMFIFTEAMLNGRPIRLFNEGKMLRDFTYVDDIVEGVRRIIDHPAEPDPAWSATAPDPATSAAPYRIYNIGNNNPTQLLDLVRTLEEALGVSAIVEFAPMQPGDVPATYADIEALARLTGFRAATPIELGVERFVRWYRDEWLPMRDAESKAGGDRFHPADLARVEQ